MESSMFAQYLVGFAFLALVSAIVTLPFAIWMKDKRLAVALSVVCSALLLKVWAYFAIGGFDPMFLVFLLIAGFLAATSVTAASVFIRKRRASSF